MDPLKAVGNLYLENQRLLNEYKSLLQLVERIKAGEVPVDSVRIDHADASWSLVVDASKAKPE